MDINETDAPEIACANGYVDIVKLLLDSGLSCFRNACVARTGDVMKLVLSDPRVRMQVWSVCCCKTGALTRTRMTAMHSRKQALTATSKLYRFCLLTRVSIQGPITMLPYERLTRMDTLLWWSGYETMEPDWNEIASQTRCSGCHVGLVHSTLERRVTVNCRWKHNLDVRPHSHSYLSHLSSCSVSSNPGRNLLWTHSGQVHSQLPHLDWCDQEPMYLVWLILHDVDLILRSLLSGQWHWLLLVCFSCHLRGLLHH